MKKPLPKGIDDFKTLIEKDYYFFDKTMLIDELLNNGALVTLLPRPRRFGKTLNMSMIKYFFDIRGKEENRKLFNGLNIEKTENIKYQGEFPVIFVSLKDIKKNNWEECFKGTKELIATLYQKNKYVLETLTEEEKINFNNILFKRENGEYEIALLKLSEYLYEYHGKKVVLLIDEYDTPLISAHTEKYYEEAINFFRMFFSTCLKGNPYLELAVMTGILRVAKENIFSGLNNLSVSSIFDEEYSHFGVTEDEVKDALEYYEMPCRIDEVTEWYDGYKFGEQYIHNPWSIINFLNKRELRPFWINTSENTIVKENISKNYDILLEDLEILARGESIEKVLTDTFVFEDINNPDNLWSLLFYSGYLTYSSSRTLSLGKKAYSLKIPNLEVRSFFAETFIKILKTTDEVKHNNMLENLLNGEIEEFEKNFKKIYRSAISYFDLPTEKENNEKYYHIFMLGFVITYSERYIVNSNGESGDGRYDVTMEPRDKKDYGIIFEFKIATEETLEEKAEEALKQIDEKEYGIKMKANGVEKIIKIGMAFAGKKVEIRSRID